MEPLQLANLFAGATGIFILIMLALWAILTFFIPFMVYSIMKSNKELVDINIQILFELQGKGPIDKRKHIEPEL
jgi:hypothetical protein